jgi:hypothetical protein
MFSIAVWRELFTQKTLYASDVQPMMMTPADLTVRLVMMAFPTIFDN